MGKTEPRTSVRDLVNGDAATRIATQIATNIAMVASPWLQKHHSNYKVTHYTFFIAMVTEISL